MRMVLAEYRWTNLPRYLVRLQLKFLMTYMRKMLCEENWYTDEISLNFVKAMDHIYG